MYNKGMNRFLFAVFFSILSSVIFADDTVSGKNGLSSSGTQNVPPVLYIWRLAQNRIPDPLFFAPCILPPDMLLIPEEQGLSVSILFDGNRYELAYGKDKRISVFPVYWDGIYRTVRVQRNEAGVPVALEFDDGTWRCTVLDLLDGLPARIRFEKENETAFAVLHYWGDSAEESWYTETGELQNLYTYGFSGGLLRDLIRVDAEGSLVSLGRWDYNAQNKISFAEDQGGSVTLLYDNQGRISSMLYSSDAQDCIERYFQYDETGRLVRQYCRNRNGSYEYRYRYTADRYEAWNSVRIQPWMQQFDRLIPRAELSVSRIITRR